QLQAGKLVTYSDNGKLTLDATNVKADRWEGDVQGLELISRQDVTKYDSKQVQAGGSVSVTYGSGGGANVNASYNAAKLNTAQVENQTSVDIGNGGMEVKVRGNTHLEGATISSQADKANNRFQTGSLTTSDIQNHSELKTESVAISGGSGGINPLSALSLLGNKNESSQSTTKAAIGENIDITLTDDPNAETTLKNLNRDTQNANQKVTKHDLTEVRETQELVKGIGEIADKAMQIYTHNEREKIEQAKLELGKAKAQKASEQEIGKLTEELNRLQADYDKEYGTGSKTKQAVDAVTAVLQGLATKDLGQAAVGLASPYLNEQIKQHTTNADGSINTEANLLAHALLGAVEAQLTGNNALAGAVAGAGGEAAAMVITNTLYPNKTNDQLTEAEKKNITFLSQLAGGLASGLVGDSTQAVASGADIAKRAVENNALTPGDVYRAVKDIKQAIKEGKSVDEVYEKYQKLSQKQRAELLADCGIDCRIPMEMLLNHATEMAENYSGFFGGWLVGLPASERERFRALVESENAITNQALDERKGMFEKGIEFGIETAQMFGKEHDLGSTKQNKKSLYDSQKTREKLENEFGKESVTSTTVPPYSAKNVKLAGQRHPKTGIPFDNKGYPIFDDIAKHDTRIDIKSFREATYTEQMSMATKQLYKELGDSGVSKKFNIEQVRAIKNGESKIPGFTWHHHQDTGRMQLVPEWEHSKTGHVGGDYIQKGK
ncbi:VENN motif pre-toxin domain-containing protein, partial [Ursidibacter arcticus]